MSYLPLSRLPILSKRLETVRSWAVGDSFFAHVARAAVARVEGAHDAADLLEAISRFQRLYIIGSLGQQTNPDILAMLDDETLITWKDFNILPATPAQLDRLADLMYGGDPQRRAPILLTLNDYARGVGELIVQKCIDKGVEFDPWIIDQRFQRHLMNKLDDAGLAAFGDLMAARRAGVARTVNFELDQSTASEIHVDGEKLKIYSDAAEARARKAARNLFYTSTRLPTPAGAAIDGMTYPEYVDLFFRMCGVDWDKVDMAHRALIHKLNAGKLLRLTNDDGTDLTMDIEGFTFANSRVAKNVPGSEVFSAPRRDSVNGLVVAKGKFAEKATNKIVEDITLEFKDGRVIRYDAAHGFEHLQRAVETDEGSHFVGEIGIGTNPQLKRHILNSLMVEKIGGSFHIALGAAYEYKDYLGEPVNLDNGNRSKLHWDITTMLYGKDGKIILDGIEIMRDGFFIDPELAYLNGDMSI